MPDLTPLKSSAVNGYAYDPQSRQLTVEFKSGGRYVYDDVPIERVTAFAGSASPGSFLAKKIQSQYRATKL